MNSKQYKLEVSKMVEITPRYLMGTKAYHLVGDISEETYDLFLADGETEKYWVGMWVFGYGYIDVIFPKETSRELTDEEVEKYNNSYIQINSQYPVKLEVSKSPLKQYSINTVSDSGDRYSYFIEHYKEPTLEELNEWLLVNAVDTDTERGICFEHVDEVIEITKFDKLLKNQANEELDYKIP